MRPKSKVSTGRYWSKLLAGWIEPSIQLITLGEFARTASVPISFKPFMKLIVEKPSPLAAMELVTCESVRGEDFGCVWHHHPECEITFVIRGGTERWVGDKLAPLTPGDIVFLGPNLPHDYRNQPRPGQRRSLVHALVVQFVPHLLGEGWLTRASMKSMQKLFERARRGLEITGQTRKAASEILQGLERTRGIKRVIRLLELLDLLSDSNDLREISSAGFQSGSQTSPSDRIGAACAEIEQRLSGPIYLHELARMSGLSKSAFSRLFKRCTNRTIPQYVNELRIARACRLLSETDQTVSQIASASGFVAPAHFHRQFVRSQNRSPLVYRRAVRDEN